MSRFVSTFLLMILVAVTASCIAKNDMVLDYKDTQFFKIEELNKKIPYKLKISGLAFHSALAVNEIKTKVHGSLLTVYVQLVQAKPGLSGSFDYELVVPESVSEVRFGNSEFVIWTRPDH